MPTNSKTPIDAYAPSNGAMIVCCNGTGDYIKREEYNKIELELSAANERVKELEKDKERLDFIQQSDHFSRAFRVWQDKPYNVREIIDLAMSKQEAK